MFIWLVVWNIALIFPYIGNNHPNWRTPSFFRGVETTKQYMFMLAGAKPDPIFTVFFVDALANHVNGGGWGGGGCINVHVDSKQKRLRWCQALTYSNILRDGFCAGIDVMWYFMGFGVGWGGGVS